MRRIACATGLLVSWLLPFGPAAAAPAYELEVVNTSDHRLRATPVALAFADLPERFSRGGIEVHAGSGDRIASQEDDLDGDGRPDELLFGLDLPPQSSRRVVLRAGTRGRAERPPSGEALAWRLWSDAHLENRWLRWHVPPLPRRDGQSFDEPPDTPEPYDPRRVFEVRRKPGGELLLDFTLESAEPVVEERAAQRVLSGPVRSAVRRWTRVHLPGQPETRFRIEDRFVLSKRSRRLDVEIRITNLSDGEREVPGRLRVLDGRMGTPLVRDLGRVETVRDGPHWLWANRSSGHGLAYLPHGGEGSVWQSETLGVDYVRFAPSPGPELRLSGVGGDLASGATRAVSFSFVFSSQETADGLHERFRRDAVEVPGALTVYGEGGEVLRVARRPRHIRDGFGNPGRWVAEPSAVLETSAEGSAIESLEPDRGVFTAFARDFARPTELRGRVEALSPATALGIEVEHLESGDLHELGTVTGTFRLDLDAALPLEGPEACLLRLTPVSTDGGERPEGGRLAVRVHGLTLGGPLPKAPQLAWPRPRQPLSAVGVSFTVRSGGGEASGYELEVAPERNPGAPTLRARFGVDRGLKGETGVSKYLPRERLQKGSYVWRARALDASGLAGPWSERQRFEVDRTDRSPKPPVRPISARRPALLVTGFRNDAGRRALREKLREQGGGLAGLIVEQRGYEPGRDHVFPVLAHFPSKVDLPRLEHAYRNSPRIVGMVFREFGFDEDYLRAVLELSARYGRYVAALNLGKDIGQRSVWSERLYPLLREYGEYMLPLQKMNNRREQLARMLTEVGAYLCGRVGNWGIETEWGYAWKPMSWRRQNKPEMATKPLHWMPPFVVGMALGASVYRVEAFVNPKYCHAFHRGEPHRFGPLWTRALGPFFEDILAHDLIPTRREMLEKTKVAVRGKEAYGLVRPGSPRTRFPSRVVAALHGVPVTGVPKQHVFENQWVPDSSAFYAVPVLPSYLPGEEAARFEEVLDADTFARPEDAVERAQAHYPPSRSEAYATRVGDTGVVIHSIDERRDPRSGPQRFRLDLTRGPVASVRGTVGHQAYLLMKQRPGSLFVHSANFATRYTELTLHPEDAGRLHVDVRPASALASEAWDPEARALEIELNHHRGVARLTVTAGQE